ncbi:sec-independent protein translocase protein TatAd [bacterium BMS3Bbin02]|nr:sec-independent protein translocase protein TatAd [bacterium BMS3Bbin02]
MFSNLGGGDFIWILLIVVVLFGAAKLPKLARSLGASASEFRKGLEDGAEQEPSQDEQGTSEND